MEQGSDGWKNWRQKGLGSSDIATAMGINPYKTAHQLWLEKTGQQEAEDISEKYHVKRGTLLEPFARDLFNESSAMNFQPAVFTHPEFDFMRYSSDGVDFEANEIIEIKCMGSRNHEKVIAEKKVLDYYYPQLQWGMEISGAKACHFIAYNPSYPDPMYVLEYRPDPEFIKQMLDEAHKFWRCVITKTMPGS